MSDAIETLRQWISESSSIVFFGGAGVSTESGIPDFRSVDGLYNQKYDEPPETIISHSYFLRWPEKFYRFYREKMLYPQAEPNDCHKALAKLEADGKLQAVVTQNIDGLHQKAGSKNVIELHGSVLRNYCMKCGKSYPVSYIMEADNCQTPAEVWEVYKKAVLDFTNKVNENKSDVLMSEKIKLSIDYILRHLHYDISLKQIADNAGLSETYFSALFKKETGETVSEFIQKSRVREAQSMIQFSEYSLLEIGQYLGFFSQSHFSKTFRKYTGMTPGQYRKKNFKRTW